MKTSKKFQNISITILSAWLGLFVLVPTLLVVLISFLQRDESDFVSFHLNLENYRLMFDPLYLKVMLNSFFISSMTTFFCLIFGYPFAFLLTKLPPHKRDLSIILVTIPFWTNSLIRTYGIKIILGSNGLFNSILMYLGLISEPLEILYTHFAVILGTVYIYFPFMVLPLYSVIEKLDTKLIDAAADLGANRIQTFVKIILPLTLPGIMAGSLLVFLPSLGCFYAADLLGGSKILLLGSVMRGQFLEARDWPFGSAMSVTLSVVMLGLLLLFFHSRKQAQISKEEMSL